MVLPGRVFQCGLQEADDLLRPEAMGAYARYGIRCVLTVAHDVRPRCVAVLPQLCLPVTETGPTPPAFFTLACRFHRDFGAILVHCNAGMHRSRVFAAALAYGLWQMGLDDAIRAADAPQGLAPPKSLVMESMKGWARDPDALARVRT